MSLIAMPTRTGPCPGRPVIDISPPMPWAIWSTPGAALIGPVLAKARDAAIDDARVDLAHRLVIDAEPVLDVDLKFSTMTSAFSASFKKIFVALLAFQVEGHRPLVAVQVLEIGAVAAAAGGVGSSPGGSILITSAPQSASWRTAVGPARCAVRSMTRKSLSGSGVIGDFSVIGSAGASFETAASRLPQDEGA